MLRMILLLTSLALVACSANDPAPATVTPPTATHAVEPSATQAIVHSLYSDADCGLTN